MKKDIKLNVDTELISEYMKSNNLTKKEFCRQSGISISALANVLKGNNFTSDTLRKLVKIVNVPYCRIFKQ